MEVTNSTLTEDPHLPVQAHIALSTALAMSFVVGTFIQVRMVLFLRSSKIRKTDIDEMILLEQEVNLLNGPIILMLLLRLLLPAASPFDMVFRNTVFCLSMEASVWIVTSHRAIGGLGIAGIRFLFLKSHNILLRIGVSRSTKLMSIAGIALSVIFAVCHVVEHYFFLDPTIMPGYNFFRSPTSMIKEQVAIFDKVAVTSFLVLNFIELVLYAFIISELHRHHKKHVALCLSNRPERATMKARKNVVTSLGHFISWVMEIVVFGGIEYVVTVTLHGDNDACPIAKWMFVHLVPSINYTVFPAVQCLTSQDLRAHVFSLRDFRGLKCRYSKDEEEEEEGENAPQGMELEALANNGNAINI